MTATPPERAWFAKADDDLELARRALGPGRPLPAMACYHAQQCAEKHLKGYLVAHDVPFRLVHDLDYLIQLCVPLNPAFESLTPAVEILNSYIASGRYPSEDAEEADLQAAQEAIHQAQQIADFVLQT